MARIPTDQRAQASIIDRLLDDEPKRSQDPAITQAQTVRNYRAAVRRDLDWLLNTRCSIVEAPEEMTEAERSLYAYGLRDYTHLSFSSLPHRQQVSRNILRAIENFEPRLSHVTIVLGDQNVNDRRTVHFQISAMLHLDPAPEPITFDATFDVARGEYRVKED
ncbi:MAG: type VI secretion system baseplate subunit TssE [Bryobacteraceae bacterium]